MKKLIISTAAMMLAFTVNSFAGTPETKGEVKPEVPTSSTSKNTMHQYGNDGTGNYRLLNNPVNPNLCEPTDVNPCTVESDQYIPEGFDKDNIPDGATLSASGEYTGS